jgi:chromosome partitioning protein
LTGLGVLAEPMLSARVDFQDAMAAGLGVTEYAPDCRAAREIEALWGWIRMQLDVGKGEASQQGPMQHRAGRQAAA